MRLITHTVGKTLAAATATLLGTGLLLAPAAGATPQPGVAADRVLASFAGPNGAGPLYGVTAGPGGTLYGTTTFGGRHGNGTVFSLTPIGSGYAEKVLFSFTGAAGSRPDNIVADAHGDLFGDATIGGSGNGVVFELTRSASGSYTEKTLHTFTGGADGSQPVGGPVLDSHGDVFGVTQFGGTGGQGVVYEMKLSPAGYSEQIVHTFSATGGQPQAGLAIAADGTLYGTLYGFGQHSPEGSVFRVRPGGTGVTYTDLYNFKGGTDGANPFGALTVDNRTGVIYGTTEYGGSTDSGTVFSLTPNGPGYTEHMLHALNSKAGQGFSPEGTLLVTAHGDVFGTVTSGGTGCAGIGCGIVFELAPASKAYTFRVVYRFTGPPDGADPEWSGLIQGPSGTMIGTTRSGGTASGCADGGPGGVHGCGTVYQITS